MINKVPVLRHCYILWKVFPIDIVSYLPTQPQSMNSTRITTTTKTTTTTAATATSIKMTDERSIRSTRGSGGSGSGSCGSGSNTTTTISNYSDISKENKCMDTTIISTSFGSRYCDTNNNSSNNNNKNSNYHNSKRFDGEEIMNNNDAQLITTTNGKGTIIKEVLGSHPKQDLSSSTTVPSMPVNSSITESSPTVIATTTTSAKNTAPGRTPSVCINQYDSVTNKTMDKNDNDHEKNIGNGTAGTTNKIYINNNNNSSSTRMGTIDILDDHSVDLLDPEPTSVSTTARTHRETILLSPTKKMVKSIPTKKSLFFAEDDFKTTAIAGKILEEPIVFTRTKSDTRNDSFGLFRTINLDESYNITISSTSTGLSSSTLFCDSTSIIQQQQPQTPLPTPQLQTQQSPKSPQPQQIQQIQPQQSPQIQQIQPQQSPQIQQIQPPIPLQSPQLQPQQSPQLQPQQSPQLQPPQSPQLQTPQSPQRQPPRSPQLQPQQSPQLQPPQSPQLQPPQSPQLQPLQSPQLQPQQSPQLQPTRSPQLQPPQSPQLQPPQSPQLQPPQSPQLQPPQSPQLQPPQSPQLQPPQSPQLQPPQSPQLQPTQSPQLQSLKLHPPQEQPRQQSVVIDEAGYIEFVVDDAIKAMFTCPLCDGLFREPITMCQCRHTFCKSCYSTAFEQCDFYDCPVCFTYLGQDDLSKKRCRGIFVADRTLEQLIDKVLFPSIAEADRLAEHKFYLQQRNILPKPEHAAAVLHFCHSHNNRANPKRLRNSRHRKRNERDHKIIATSKQIKAMKRMVRDMNYVHNDQRSYQNNTGNDNLSNDDYVENYHEDSSTKAPKYNNVDDDSSGTETSSSSSEDDDDSNNEDADYDDDESSDDDSRYFSESSSISSSSCSSASYSLVPATPTNGSSNNGKADAHVNVDNNKANNTYNSKNNRIEDEIAFRLIPHRLSNIDNKNKGTASINTTATLKGMGNVTGRIKRKRDNIAVINYAEKEDSSDDNGNTDVKNMTRNYQLSKNTKNILGDDNNEKNKSKKNDNNEGSISNDERNVSHSKEQSLPPLEMEFLQTQGRIRIGQLKQYLYHKLNLESVLQNLSSNDQARGESQSSFNSPYSHHKDDQVHPPKHHSPQLEIYCNSVPLGNELSVVFVSRTVWMDPNSLLTLTYGLRH